jgi:hypothetical protein
LDSVNVLLTLILKDFRVPCLHARLNFYYEGFWLCDKSLPAATSTLFSEHFASAWALTARLLHLHSETPHLHVLNHLALSAAFGTDFKVAALCAWAFALAAVNISLNLKFFTGSRVKFFKCNLNGHLGIGSLLSSVPTSKQSISQKVLTIRIVPLPLRLVSRRVASWWGHWALRKRELLLQSLLRHPRHLKRYEQLYLPGFLSGWYFKL